MELSKPRLLVKSFYNATEYRPSSLALPARLYKDLTSLSKEEIGPESDPVERITNVIEGFGIKPATLEHAAYYKLTTKQWRRLRDTIKKHYPEISEWPLAPSEMAPGYGRDGPTDRVIRPLGYPTSLPPLKKYIAPHVPFASAPKRFLQYRVDLTRLPQEAVAILMSLIEAISSDRLLSSITVPVLDYFSFVKILSEEWPDLIVLLDPVKKVLEGHGWTDGGFLSLPDQKLLLEDFQAIVGHGLESYRQFRIEPAKKQLPPLKEVTLAGSLISTLITSLEPRTADETVREFLELVSMIAESDEKLEEEMRPVRSLLKTRGWIGDRFEETPDCATLKNELRTILV